MAPVQQESSMGDTGIKCESESCLFFFANDFASYFTKKKTTVRRELAYVPTTELTYICTLGILCLPCFHCAWTPMLPGLNSDLTL